MGGSSSSQTSQTDTYTSTVQGIEDEAIVAGGNVTMIDGGAVQALLEVADKALTANTSVAGENIDALEAANSQMAGLGHGVLDFANDALEDSLAAYGNTALALGRANSSEQATAFNDMNKTLMMGMGALALAVIAIGVLK